MPDFLDVSSIKIAMNDAGDAVVEWYEQYSIWTARHTFEDGWSEHELLWTDTDEGEGYFFVTPTVAVADDGYSMVLWDTSPGSPLLGSSSDWGEEWEPVEPVPGPETARGRTPDLAMDGNNTSVVVWIESPRPYEFWYDEIWSNGFTPGEGWGSAVRLAEAGGAGGAQLAGGFGSAPLSMNRSGNAVAVWAQASHPKSDPSEWQQDIWASRAEAGKAWTTPELISVAGDANYAPDVAIDPEGNALAVWCGETRAMANRFTAGVGWGTPEVIDVAGTLHTFTRDCITVGMDDDGNAIAIWSGLWSNRYTIAAGWGSPERISDMVDDDAAGTLAVGSAGDAMVVWGTLEFPTPGEAASVSTWSNRYVPGVGWGQPELVNAVGDPADVAVDGDGNALLVWASRPSVIEPFTGLWSSTSHRPQ